MREAGNGKLINRQPKNKKALTCIAVVQVNQYFHPDSFGTLRESQGIVLRVCPGRPDTDAGHLKAVVGEDLLELLCDSIFRVIYAFRLE